MKAKAAYPIVLILFLSGLISTVNAEIVTREASIIDVSIDRAFLIADIEVNKIKLAAQRFPVDQQNIQVWYQQYRINPRYLRPKMKIQFKTNDGKVVNVRVLDSAGHQLIPQG